MDKDDMGNPWVQIAFPLCVGMQLISFAASLWRSGAPWSGDTDSKVGFSPSPCLLLPVLSAAYSNSWGCSLGPHPASERMDQTGLGLILVSPYPSSKSRALLCNRMKKQWWLWDDQDWPRWTHECLPHLPQAPYLALGQQQHRPLREHPLSGAIRLLQ